MFSEVLRIKPILDAGTTASMERSLTSRFTSVAKKFSHGLRQAARGAVLGISLGLLSKLLSPINDIEEKIKSLLGQGSDIRDLADKFQTDPGKMKRLEDIAKVSGVSSEKLKDMLDKFQEAIIVKSPAVKNFSGKDQAEGFFSFIQALKGMNEKDRLLVERNVFGERQFGSARKFIEANPAELAQGIPSAALNAKALKRLGVASDVQNRLQAVNDAKDFLATSNKINPSMIQAMEESRQRAEQRLNAQMKSFLDLEKAAKGIDEVKFTLENILTAMGTLVGKLGTLLESIRKIETSRIWKSWIGGGK